MISYKWEIVFSDEWSITSKDDYDDNNSNKSDNKSSTNSNNNFQDNDSSNDNNNININNKNDKSNDTNHAPLLTPFLLFWFMAMPPCMPLSLLARVLLFTILSDVVIWELGPEFPNK